MREREGLGRFGLPNLDSATAQLVEGATLLILRTIVLAEASNEGLEATAAEGLASKSQPHVKGSWLLFFGMEHPEDPFEYLSPHLVPNAQLLPSIWKWPEVKSFVDRNGLHEASFHQGMLGHQAVKPTRVITSSGYLWE